MHNDKKKKRIKSTSVIKEANKQIHQSCSPGFSNKEKTETTASDTNRATTRAKQGERIP